MPFDKSGIKPRIDRYAHTISEFFLSFILDNFIHFFRLKSGFIFEDVVVPVDYIVTTPRNNLTPLDSNNSSNTGSQIGKNFYKLEPIRESDFAKKKSDINRY